MYSFLLADQKDNCLFREDTHKFSFDPIKGGGGGWTKKKKKKEFKFTKYWGGGGQIAHTFKTCLFLFI